MSINVALQPMLPVTRTPNRSGAIIFDKPVAGTVITDIITLAKTEITQSYPTVAQQLQSDSTRHRALFLPEEIGLIVATPTTCGFKDWSSKLVETGRFLGIEFLGSLPLAPHLDDLEAKVFQKLDLPDGVIATQHTFLKALELFSQPNTKAPKT